MEYFVVQDYRAESYKKRAGSISRGEVTPSEKRRGITESSSTISEGSISINPKYVVSEVGGVAIVGGNQPDKYQYVTQETTTPSTQTTQQPTESVKQIFQQEQVQVSPGVASKLAQQSLSSESKYYVTPSQRAKTLGMNVDRSPMTKPSTRLQRAVSNVKEARFPGTDTRIVEIAPFVSPIFALPKFFELIPTPPYAEAQAEYIVGGIKYGLTGKKSGETTNVVFGIPTPMSFPKEQVAFGEVLVGSYSSVSAKPLTLKESKVTFATRSPVSVVESSEGIVGTSKVTGYGKIEVKSFGKSKVEPFKITGEIKEVAKPIDTEIFGIESAEQVYRTRGYSNLNIKLPKKVIEASTESVGFEVGGAGRRNVVSQVGTQVPERFNEVYYVTGSEESFKGAIVSSKGGSVFSGTKQAEVSLNVPSSQEYFNPETGLKSSTSTLSFTPDEIVTAKYYRVASGGLSDRPLSSEYVYEVVGDRLRGNLQRFVSGDSVVSGGVSDVARQQTVQVVKSPVGVRTFNVRQSVLSSVKSELSSDVVVRSPSVILSSPVGSLKSDIVSESVVGQVVVSEKKLSVGSSLNLRSVGVEKTSVSNVGGLSSFSLGNVVGSRGKSELLSKSIVGVDNAIGLKPIQSVFPVQSVMGDGVLSQRLVYNRVSNFGVRSPVLSNGFFGGVVPKIYIRGSEGGFGVSVRRGGVFREVGRGLSLKQALGKGVSVVGGTAAASFRITKQGKPFMVSAPSGFRRKGATLIEESKFRINTPGELKGITLLGIRKQGRGGF